MKCKDCLHYKVCRKWYILTGHSAKEADEIVGREITGGFCTDLSDKSMTIELPCKVGDKVYVHYVSPSDEIKETIVDKIIIHKEFTKIVFSNRSEFTIWDNDWSTYKKVVFRTREEAEKALEETENESNQRRTSD